LQILIIVKYRYIFIDNNNLISLTFFLYFKKKKNFISNFYYFLFILLFIYLDKWDFRDLKISAIPNNYILNFTIYNNNKYKEEIKLDIPEIIKVKINDCNEKQIKLYNEYNVMYCEYAKCLNSCQIGEKAECIPSEDNIRNHSNNPQKNECRCSRGYYGNGCKNKKYDNYRYSIKKRIIF